MSSLISSLVEFYDDYLAKDSFIGYSREKSYICVEITNSGDFFGITPLWEESGKKKLPKILDLPTPPKRSANIAPNYFCDTIAYSMGFSFKQNDRPKEKNDAFIELHRSLPDDVKKDEAVSAFLKFLDQLDKYREAIRTAYCEILGIDKDESKDDEKAKQFMSSLVVFRINGDSDFIVHRPLVKDFIASHVMQSSDNPAGVCSVTGKTTRIARLHDKIKGIDGDTSAGGGSSIVSFNDPAFCSYDKNQGENAPIGVVPAKKYAAALNYLLSNQHHHVRLGEMSLVFWWSKDSEVSQYQEHILQLLGAFRPPEIAQQTKSMDVTKTYHGTLHKGYFVLPKFDDQNTQFYVAAMTARNGRVVLTMFENRRFSEIIEHIKQHEIDTQADRNKSNSLLTVNRILVSIFHKGESSKIEFDKIKKSVPAVLKKQLISSILFGAPYPIEFYQNAINRFRLDVVTGNNYQNALAGLIQGYLVREGKIDKEVIGMLHEESKSKAYHLGRMFACAEIVQRRAIQSRQSDQEVKASLASVFPSASMTPKIAFPHVLRMYKIYLAHFADKPGLQRWYDSIMIGIMERIDAEDPINAIPAFLNLEEQGMFTLGYYHQLSWFFTKKGEDNGKEQDLFSESGIDS